MNRWERCSHRAEDYWFNVFGRGPVAHTCITVTMVFVGVAFVFDTFLLMPFAIHHSLREKK